MRLERRRVLRLVPTPRPLPSSVSMELSGVYTRQGPGRSTVAHAAKQHAVVVLSVAGQAVPTRSAQVVSHFFSSGEKCEKPLRQRVQEKPKKTLRNPGLVENFEDLDLDLGTRCSAP